MKHTYSTPESLTRRITLTSLFCASGVSGGDEGPGKDIDYGGVDEDGTKDPASRRRYDVWADDDEEEEEE